MCMSSEPEFFVKCPSCRVKIAEDDILCPNCGADLE
ncbi:zinc-ribbon domain-containing protein [Candidatus Woesearchaeota archaeon]|nr:MAG: zinc-ribbon domain-containing protein [Candidatus Woesearchaeota archaeon]